MRYFYFTAVKVFEGVNGSLFERLSKRITMDVREKNEFRIVSVKWKLWHMMNYVYDDYSFTVCANACLWKKALPPK